MEKDIPTEMNTVAIREPGEPDVLTPVRRPVPQPQGRQILIRVAAAGVNRPDVLQRQGHYPPPPGASEIPGLEVAGEVVSVGPDAGRYNIGDKVCALVSGGGYSEYSLAHEGSALPVPKQLTDLEAAAVPETVFTVWHNVFQRGRLQPGEWFLVHGGASGIGAAAIQIAKSFGARVLTTVSSAEKVQFCRDLGAEHAINYTEQRFPEVVKEVTSGAGVNVILDMIGGDYIDKNITCAAEDGRIVQIAFLNGPVAEINFARIMVKRLTFTGSTLRPRTDAVKQSIAEDIEKNVWPMIERGEFKPVIDSVYPLNDAAEAHKRMESRGHKGKIVLSVS